MHPLHPNVPGKSCESNHPLLLILISVGCLDGPVDRGRGWL